MIFIKITSQMGSADVRFTKEGELVFGLFRKSEPKSVDTSSLGATFDQLAFQCPAGAYMFASQLGTGMLALTSGQHPSWLRKRLLEDMASEGTKTFGIDKGSSLLAAQSLLKIANSKPNGFSVFVPDEVIVRITAVGQRYRKLQERDRIPPTHEFDQKFLAHVGATTLAEWMKLIRSRPSAGTADTQEEIDRSMACFDLLEEHRSKDLLVHFAKIDAWVKS